MEKHKPQYVRREIEEAVNSLQKRINKHYGLPWNEELVNSNLPLPLRVTSVLGNYLGTFEGYQILEDVRIVIDGYKQLVHNGFFKE